MIFSRQFCGFSAIRLPQTEEWHMKKLIVVLGAVFSLLLSACGSAAAATFSGGGAATVENTNGGQAPDTARLSTSSEEAASVEVQPMIGTFKLEGTNPAVTADKAKGLLPLWQQVQSLLQSTMHAMGSPGKGQGESTPAAKVDASAVQSQIDGVLGQIRGAMTAGQIQAVADIKITRESAAAAIKGLGITPGGPGGGQPPNGNGPQQPGGDGQQPGGNGQPPQSEDGQPASTPPAGGQTGRGGRGDGMMERMLVDAMVQLLQNRAGVRAQSGGTSAGQGGPSSSGGGSATLSGAYSLEGGSDSQTGQTYKSDIGDQSTSRAAAS
jgi:hypothetical protein